MQLLEAEGLVTPWTARSAPCVCGTVPGARDKGVAAPPPPGTATGAGNGVGSETDRKEHD
jgi:hypothetical protein